MPGPPGNEEKFVVTIEVPGPLDQTQLDRLKKDFQAFVAKIPNGKIAGNQIEPR